MNALKKVASSNWWVIAIVIIFIVGFARGMSSADDDETTDETVVTETSVASVVGADYFDILVSYFDEEEIFTKIITDDSNSYTLESESYTITVESNADDDEITYVSVEVLEWGENVDGVNLITSAIDELQIEGLSSAAKIDFINYIVDEPDIFDEIIIETLGTNTASFTLSPDDDGILILEIEF